MNQSWSISLEEKLFSHFFLSKRQIPVSIFVTLSFESTWDTTGKSKSTGSVKHIVSKRFGTCKKATLEKIISRNHLRLLQKLDGY